MTASAVFSRTGYDDDLEFADLPPATPTLDLVNLFQRVRVRKTGECGSITQVHEMKGQNTHYIEVNTDTGRTLWPLTPADLEPCE